MQAAWLFRAAAEAETVHALNYLKAIRGVRGTRENLQEAISVESRAFKSVYPEMVEAAKGEGNREAEDFFRYALESERVHAELFQKLADALGNPGENYSYYVCPVCGHTAEKTPPSTCPICGIKDLGYKKMEWGDSAARIKVESPPATVHTGGSIFTVHPVLSVHV